MNGFCQDRASEQGSIICFSVSVCLALSKPFSYVLLRRLVEARGMMGCRPFLFVCLVVSYRSRCLFIPGRKDVQEKGQRDLPRGRAGPEKDRRRDVCRGREAETKTRIMQDAIQLYPSRSVSGNSVGCRIVDLSRWICRYSHSSR